MLLILKGIFCLLVKHIFKAICLLSLLPHCCFVYLIFYFSKMHLSLSVDNARSVGYRFKTKEYTNYLWEGTPFAVNSM